MEKKTVLAIILITLVLTVSMVIQGTMFTNNTASTATAETEQTQSTPVSETDVSKQDIYFFNGNDAVAYMEVDEFFDIFSELFEDYPNLQRSFS